MGRLIDLKGQKYGRLLVKKLSRRHDKAVYWDCLCDCGKRATVRSNDLRKGHIKSCGCLLKENLAGGKNHPSYKHGLSRDPLYSMWRHAKERAAKNGVVFTITFNDMPEVPKKCPVFPWIELKPNTGNKKIAEHSPTLDRVIPSLG